MKIALVVAMQVEFDLVKNIFSSYTEVEEKNLTFFRGNIGNHEIALIKSGIGKVNAAVKVAELINTFSPDMLINTGVAGGISTNVGVGEIVVAEECCYHDVWCGTGAWGQVQGLPLYFSSDYRIIEALKSLEQDNMHFGLICTGDQFITENIGLEAIQRRFPQGLAVDMESAAMAHVCYQRSVPFASVRVISDTPDKSADNHTQYFDFWETAPKLTFEVIRQLLQRLD